MLPRSALAGAGYQVYVHGVHMAKSVSIVAARRRELVRRRGSAANRPAHHPHAARPSSGSIAPNRASRPGRSRRAMPLPSYAARTPARRSRRTAVRDPRAAQGVQPQSRSPSRAVGRGRGTSAWVKRAPSSIRSPCSVTSAARARLGRAARRTFDAARAGRVRLAVPTVCLFEVRSISRSEDASA